MKDETERRKNNEYVEKVLLPEALIKFYSDFFHVGILKAERQIALTPLRYLFSL